MSDFHDMNGVGTSGGAGALGATVRRPYDRTEYAIRYFDGRVTASYDAECTVMQALAHQHRELARMGIPQTVWPVKVTREIATSIGEWVPPGE